MKMRIFAALTLLAALGCEPAVEQVEKGDPAPTPRADVASVAPVQAEDGQDAPVREDIEIDFEIQPVRVGRFWTFRFEGDTNLPHNALVKVTVFYPEPWERQLPDGTQQRDTIADYLFMKDYEKAVRIDEEGSFAVDLYHIRRRPYSMSYRARVTCAADDQDPDMLESLNTGFRFGREGKTASNVDFRFGNPADMEKELQGTARDFVKDFREFYAIYDEMKEHFTRHRRGFDAESWAQFRLDIAVRLARIEEGNKERFTLFKIFWERRGKFYVNDIVNFLRKDAELVEEALRNPSDETLQTAYKEQRDTLAGIRWREAEIGIEKVKTEALTGPLGKLAERVAQTIDLAREASKEGIEAGEWTGKRDTLRNAVNPLVIELAREDVERTAKLYPYVAEVAAGIEEVLSAVDGHVAAPSDDTRGAIRTGTDRLEAALAELKKFVGVK